MFKDTSELIYQTKIDLQILKTDLRLPKRKHGGGRGDKLGAQRNTYMLPYIRRITNKDLLYKDLPYKDVLYSKLDSIFCDNLHEKAI